MPEFDPNKEPSLRPEQKQPEEQPAKPTQISEKTLVTQLAMRTFEKGLRTIVLKQREYTEQELERLFNLDFESVLLKFLPRRTTFQKVAKPGRSPAYVFTSIINEPLIDPDIELEGTVAAAHRKKASRTAGQDEAFKKAREQISEFLQNQPKQRFTSVQIAEALGIPKPLVTSSLQILMRSKTSQLTSVIEKGTTFFTRRQ